MKKIILILSFFPFILLMSKAQSPERFNKSIDLGYGPKEWGEWGNGMVLNDTSFLGAGVLFLDTSYAEPPAFFRTNKSGDLLWRKVLQRPYTYAFGAGKNLMEHSNGEFLACGALFLDTVNYNSDSGKAFLMGLDSNGGYQWEKWYGDGYFHAKFQDIHETESGDLLIVGKAYDNSNSSSCDVYLVKTDLQGNVIWERTYGGSAYDDCVSIITHGKGFLLAGSTKSYGSGGFDGYIIKVDSNGNKLWQKTDGSSDTETLIFLKEYLNGGYIGVGG